MLENRVFLMFLVLLVGGCLLLFLQIRWWDELRQPLAFYLPPKRLQRLIFIVFALTMIILGIVALFDAL